MMQDLADALLRMRDDRMICQKCPGDDAFRKQQIAVLHLMIDAPEIDDFPDERHQ